MTINRIKCGFAAALCVCAFTLAEAGEFSSALVGRVTYTDSDGWSVAVETKTPESGVEEWQFSFAADKPSDPPRTTIECAFPLKDAVGRWTTGAGLFKKLPPNWAGGFSSTLYSQAPVIAYFSDSNVNRGVVACSEALRRVNFEMGIVEETAQSSCKVSLFSESEPPLSSYQVSIRIDLRPVFYADALRAAFAWYETMPAYKPVAVPAAAFDPLYSFWYSYHQEVTAPSVEKECAAAVPYGMKTIIVDDGWQTDDNNRGYSYCGDWQVSTNRFPDFAAHVRKVHDMGLKYMIWYGVPMVGFNSVNYNRFKGKYLWSDSGRWSDYACLDPRFPEVREFLIGNYEHALRDWGVDGLKLDFIDAFGFRGEDPAVKENYAGRDIKSLPEAIDRLMTDVNKRLAAIKPDVLIEFRQSYIGPAIRKYGNMFRAGDCPMDTLINRVCTLDLRLSSGNAAVHSDMLMWNAKESPEVMSKQFWSILFAVPQISMRLEELPAAQRAKLHEMLDFWLAHRETLMKGELQPLRPDLNYPIVYAYGKGEQVVAVYDPGQVVNIDRTRGAKVYVVNATDAKALVVRENGKVREVQIAPCSAAQVEAAEAPRDIVVEAESFAEKGGWVTDTQFMDQMGSPFLLAHGLGTPVADAATTFGAEAGGRRVVYVRTRNWNAPWSSHPAGLFRVSVNGEALPVTLGAGAAEWTWRRAGEVTLKAGANALALHDLTGFEGRCDAIAFAAGERTESELDAFRATEQRAKPVVRKAYDFVVVGGGVAGICAAVTAARQGLRTALVHDRPVLGGNNSSEVRVHLGAYANLPPYPRLGDVLAEIAPAEGGNAQPAAVYEDARKLAVVKAEKSLDLFLDTRVNGVERAADGAIASVTGVDTATGARTVFAAPLFADTTGDGTVGFLAGADWRMGREGRDAHGEPWAPETGDRMTMGASVQWRAATNATAVAFSAEPWMLPFDERTAQPGLRGDWDWETGLRRDQIVEAERIRDYGLLVVYSNWSYLKNGFSRRADYATAALEWVAYVAGRRESRRLIGDFILTENHLMSRDVQPDGTCAATWTIDQHFPKEASVTGFAGEAFQADSHNHVIWPYPIPYRCLYSRNVPNLFMAGRDISVTHVALGTTRLMRTHGMMGEVVGMAAAVCRAQACRPRDVYARHFGALRAKMERGAGDGRVHPIQTYNCQESLDPDIRSKVRQLQE